MGMTTDRWTLRRLPLTTRLVLALFLVSVGAGYGAGIVQIHFQHAGPGDFMPTTREVIVKFHGDPDPSKRTSTLQRLLTADETLSFNGSGSMAAAFTSRSQGWKSAIREKPEAEVRTERTAERDAVLAWVAGGLNKEAFEADRFALPPDLASRPLTADFKGDDGTVKIKSLWTERCGRCHQKDGDDANAANYPLDTLAAIQPYARVESAPGAMSVTKLAQSTHAHLLSFSVLFMLTGLLFTLTDYPGWLRATLGPLVLLTQLVDISCWWLARLEGPLGERFAVAIMCTGGVVAGGLALQIVLTLFHLFGLAGRAVLVLLFVAAGAGVGVLKQQVIDPHLASQATEKAAAAPKTGE